MNQLVEGYYWNSGKRYEHQDQEYQRKWRVILHVKLIKILRVREI
jgi:hypothetical protein